MDKQNLTKKKGVFIIINQLELQALNGHNI